MPTSDLTVETEHPQYIDQKGYWVKLRDAMKGEDAVKKKGIAYLPATSGMVFDGFLRGEELGLNAYLSLIHISEPTRPY